MKLIFIGLILSVAFCHTETEEAFWEVFEKNGLIGMSVVSVCKGEIQDSYNFGESDISRSVKVNDETRFWIASISKFVTTLGFMKIWEDLQFDLDEDISKTLGF